MAKFENHNLMIALDYRDTDVALNRQFKLSERQKRKLKGIIELNILGSFFFTAICFIAALGGLFAGLSSGVLFILTLVAVLGFGFGFFWAFRSIQWERKMKKYRGVEMIEGRAAFDVTYKSGLTNQTRNEKFPVYTMKIGNIKFHLDEKTYDSAAGSHFRVYYFQTLRIEILSVENID